ncbi:MAG: hypothetical protein J7M38_06705 [Armatimonadetes bacterium]|nr:hypothetical protein [Armatimonadota bacterium]
MPRKKRDEVLNMIYQEAKKRGQLTVGDVVRMTGYAINTAMYRMREVAAMHNDVVYVKGVLYAKVKESGEGTERVVL